MSNSGIIRAFHTHEKEADFLARQRDAQATMLYTPNYLKEGHFLLGNKASAVGTITAGMVQPAVKLLQFASMQAKKSYTGGVLGHYVAFVPDGEKVLISMGASLRANFVEAEDPHEAPGLSRPFLPFPYTFSSEPSAKKTTWLTSSGPRLYVPLALPFFTATCRILRSARLRRRSSAFVHPWPCAAPAPGAHGSLYSSTARVFGRDGSVAAQHAAACRRHDDEARARCVELLSESAVGERRGWGDGNLAAL